jgi:hypothetical protein
MNVTSFLTSGLNEVRDGYPWDFGSVYQKEEQNIF